MIAWLKSTVFDSWISSRYRTHPSEIHPALLQVPAHHLRRLIFFYPSTVPGPSTKRHRRFHSGSRTGAGCHDHSHLCGLRGLRISVLRGFIGSKRHGARRAGEAPRGVRPRRTWCRSLGEKEGPLPDPSRPMQIPTLGKMVENDSSTHVPPGLRPTHQLH